jgi:Contractile injection system tube protein/LysM domain
MQKPLKAQLLVQWGPGDERPIEVAYNPTELSFSKGAQIAEIDIPGLDAPLFQYVRGQAETLTLDLFFDSTEHGMGASVTSVTETTDKFYQLVKLLPDRHAPPVCTFVWGTSFPGANLYKAYGGARRMGFQCIVDSVKHKYTLFSPNGIPLRATLTLSLREYRPLDQQLLELHKNSPDRTQFHVLAEGEDLSLIAGRHYYVPGDWRVIADANGIEDPRRLQPGTFLRLPPNQ